MNPCMVTTGFFVLGRCGRQSASWCPQCRRALCGEHQGPNGLCPDCATAHGYSTQDPHDPRWTQGYRRTYYQRTSQTYSDPGYYAAFDTYDREAFSPGNDYSSGGEYDHGDESGLVDS